MKKASVGVALRMTNLYSNSDEETMMSIMERSIGVQLFLSVGAMFGLILINKQLIPWFFGDEFLILKYIVPVMSPIVILVPLGVSIVRQYLMPRNRIKQFNISVLITALVSVVLNLSLIPVIGIWGAIVASLISETLVVTIRLFDLYKHTVFRLPYVFIFKYMFAGLIMYISVSVVTNNMASVMMTTMIQCFLGGVLYMIFTVIFKCNPFFDYFIKRVKSKTD